MQENKEFLKQEKKNKKLEKKRLKLEAREKEKALEEPKRLEIKAKNEPPQRGLLEEIGNSVSHGVGALIAIVLLILLILKSDTPLKLTASIVYGGCMFIMLLMSCLYHAFKKGSTVKRIWRRFDYTSIYLQIGGTFAPIYLIWLGNTLGIVLFIVQWVLIITGITFVCIFGPGRVKILNFILYFAIGWSGIMFIPMWIKTDLPLLLWILAGGLAYTLGMIPFAKKNVKSAHFIWHILVVVGVVLQFIGIYLYIY